MSKLDYYRRNVSAVARAQDGAHYIHGGFGNVPGVANGHPRYTNRVVMSPRVTTGPRQILFAAMCDSNHRAYCAGRCRVMEASGKPQIPDRELQDLARLAVYEQQPDRYLWPRPKGLPSGRIVHGESCLGRRHFDCVGFVDWCIFQACGVITIADIARYHARGMDSPRNRVEITDARPGDLLLIRQEHIGVMIDGGMVAQAVSTEWGVTISRLSPSQWTLCVRLDAGFFT